MSALRFFAQLHGHIGWLAVASLLHPSLLLRGGRGAGVALVATCLTVGTFGFGAALYPSYRAEIKHGLFVNYPAIGWAFERKEHLAVSAAIFSLLGLLAVRAARRRVEDAEGLLRLARRAYALAFVVALAVAILGTLVASVRSF